MLGLGFVRLLSCITTWVIRRTVRSCVLHRSIILSPAAEDYKPPDELMQVKLPLIERDICSAWHNDTMNFVDDSMVCAGYEEGGRGACFVSMIATVCCPPVMLTRQNS